MKGPWQALPSRLLPNLKSSCGLPFEVSDIATISLAGRARVGLVTATSFSRAWKELQDALVSGDRVLSILDQN